MKPRLLLSLLLLTVLASAAEIRTWTDPQGRTLSGEFVEANAQEVTVRRADGTTAKIPRALLSAADLAFADRAQANKPVTVTIEVSRAKFETKTNETATTPPIITSVEQWGFNVTISNQSPAPGLNLRADYRLFFRRTTAIGDVLAKQPLDHQTGTAIIAKLDPKGKAAFRTLPLAITTQQIKGGVWAVTGNSSDTNTQLEGIWIRVYQGNKMIAEYLSAESLRKDGWPGDPAPAKSGPVAKPVTSPPAPKS